MQHNLTEEERLQSIDLESAATPLEDVLWALNYLLQLPTDDDEPLFA